jgi:hypothetical protein
MTLHLPDLARPKKKWGTSSLLLRNCSTVAIALIVPIMFVVATARS